MRDKQTIFRYGGYEMRSHSETRWAAIMDVMGVTWVYEPRTVTTRHGGYMPDFFLPAVGAFLEVKGPTPSNCSKTLRSSQSSARHPRSVKRIAGVAA